MSNSGWTVQLIGALTFVVLEGAQEFATTGRRIDNSAIYSTTSYCVEQWHRKMRGRFAVVGRLMPFVARTCHPRRDLGEVVSTLVTLDKNIGQHRIGNEWPSIGC